MVELVFNLRDDGFYRIGTNSVNEKANGYIGTIGNSLEIPPTHDEKEVIEIGRNAFISTKSLQSVKLNSNLRFISSRAFDGCSLTSITIPSSVETLSAWCFSTNQLTSVFIPSSVSSIGNDPFGNNQQLSKIEVDPKNPYYVTDIYGSLMNKKQTIFIQALPIKERIVVPHTIHTILRQAFDQNSKFQEIIITGNVKQFDESSFHKE